MDHCRTFFIGAELSYYSYRQQQAAERLKANAAGDWMIIESLKNENGTLTASVATQSLTIKEWKEKYIKNDAALKEVTKRFSKIKSVTTVVTKATIDTIDVQFDKPIETNNGFVRSGDLSKDWLTANYKVNEKGFQLSGVLGTIGVTTVTGFKKNWFFGKQTAMTDVTPTIPNVTIVQMTSTDIVVPVRFYETKLFLIGTGFLLKSLIPNPKF